MIRRGNTMEFKAWIDLLLDTMNEQGLPRDKVLLVDAYLLWQDKLSVTEFISWLKIK